MHSRISSIVAFVVVPIVTASLVTGYVWHLRGLEERHQLLSQFNAVTAPATDAIMTDDVLMKTYIVTYGPAPTMKVLIAAAEHAHLDCHNRAHQFGRVSYEEFGDEVLKLSLPECHSGFYHGAIEAYFRKNGTDHLSDKLSFICPDSLNLFFMHQCRHGLGHGLMAWSNYDLPATLDFCDMIKDDGGKSSCRTGAFMENIVGSLADSDETRALGHFTKFLSKDPQYPCTVVKDEYKGDCYFLQTDRMYQLNRTFQAVADGCAGAPEAYQYTCYPSMGRTISGLTRGQPEKALQACRLIKDHTHRVECIDAVAKDQLWDPSGADAGIRFCSMVPPEDGQDACYRGLLYHAAFVLSAEQRTSFCPKIPATLREQCLQGSAYPSSASA
jgi:hypothetical protein